MRARRPSDSQLKLPLAGVRWRTCVPSRRRPDGYRPQRRAATVFCFVVPAVTVAAAACPPAGPGALGVRSGEPRRSAPGARPPQGVRPLRAHPADPMVGSNTGRRLPQQAFGGPNVMLAMVRQPLLAGPTHGGARDASGGHNGVGGGSRSPRGRSRCATVPALRRGSGVGGARRRADADLHLRIIRSRPLRPDQASV
jgi:hypothetical protein